MNFREWPLVLFTLLFQAAAGASAVFCAMGFLAGSGRAESGGRTFGPGAALLIFVPAALATAISLFHLGRPGRAPQSIRNLGRSWLSREIILLLTFNATTATLVISEAAGIETGRILGPIAVAGGFACVFVMSRIYMLPSVPDWNSWRTPVAFFSSAFVLGGLAAGVYVGHQVIGKSLLAPSDGAPGLRLAVLVMLDTAFVLTIFLAPRFGLAGRRPTPLGFLPNPAWPRIFLIRLALLASAILLWILGFGLAALFAAAVSEIIGRLQFYDLPLGLSPRKS